MSKNISNKAEVSPIAKIGKNVKIAPFTFIEEDVIIGANTTVGPNVTIYNGARIGDNCTIFPGAVISALPQDLKYKGENTIVEIGNNTIIRECVTINKGTASKGITRIGNNCLLMAYVHVSHDCLIGDYCIISNSVQIGGEVEIDDWAVIGGVTAIHQFSRIGKHAMVSGMSGILSDVPPFLRVAGFPAVYKGINYVGLKRRNFSSTTIENIHNIFRMIYQKGLNTSQAVENIEHNFIETDEQKNILSFIKESKRGIVRTDERRVNIHEHSKPTL